MVPDEEGFYTIGDMELSKEQMLDFFGLRNGKKRAGLSYKRYRWPKGRGGTLLKILQGTLSAG